MDTRLDDIEFLVGSNHRVGVLEALAEHPCERDELRTVTGASSPTMGRILSDFEDRRWIEREGQTCHLTGLGRFVADRLEEFLDAMSVERRLRDVSPWLPYELDGFSVELFTEAVVSYPGQGYPYEPLDRNVQLVEETETVRGFGMVLLKASVLEQHFEAVLDGLECEFIYSPDVFETMLDWSPETVAEAVRQDNYTVLLHDSLPQRDWCGICLFDDRTSVCCYEPDTGMLRSLVDTGAPEAYTWGEGLFEQYRREARPLGDADDLFSANSFSSR